MRILGFMITLAALLVALPAFAADDWGLKPGTVELKSAGNLAFGPDGILFIGDSKGASIVAIATGDTKGDPAKAEFNVEGVADKIAAKLGGSASDMTVGDIAVNPKTGNLFLAVNRKSGGPAIVKIASGGEISEVSLKDIPTSSTQLANAPEDKQTGEGPRARNLRNDTITDLHFINGKVLVSGMSAGTAPTTVREISFPFAQSDPGTNLEIYHGAHGKTETNSQIRTFVPFTINGEPSLLAGFVCTPLVKFSLKSLKPGDKAKGTTVAELGNMNRPLDMIVYEKDGKTFLLLANSARGVMKISTADIEKNEGITAPVRGGTGTAGQPFETIKDLTGVVQLDKLNDKQAVVVVQKNSGMDLKTIALP